MKENEEKNSSCNQNLRTKEKEKSEGLHYKKIKIKPIKKDNININDNYKPNDDFDILDKNIFNPNINKINQNKNENKKIEEDKNFMFEDINNQLDEILENIENDGIEEINKKIKLLNEDKNMFNTISYSYNDNDNINEKDWNYKKIDNKNKNKLTHKRNKIINDKNNINHINNYKHYNQNNKYHIHENRNITNNRYLFSDFNNTYRNWKEENNCDNDNDECDNYLNKTNISLFYKYNKLYNPKKSDDEE